MLLQYIFIPILLIFPSQKRELTGSVLPASELLINRQWVLTSYGFDENKNGRIDVSEERIQECEKDDTYEFYPNGTGMMNDNFFSCCNGIDEQTFKWRLNGNGHSMIAFAERLSITRLTTRELITQKKISFGKIKAVNLITVYKTRQ